MRARRRGPPPPPPRAEEDAPPRRARVPARRRRRRPPPRATFVPSVLGVLTGSRRSGRAAPSRGGPTSAPWPSPAARRTRPGAVLRGRARHGRRRPGRLGGRGLRGRRRRGRRRRRRRGSPGASTAAAAARGRQGAAGPTAARRAGRRAAAVGCRVDVDKGEASFSVNGADLGVAFRGVAGPLSAALSLEDGEAVRVALDRGDLRFGPPAGYRALGDARLAPLAEDEEASPAAAPAPAAGAPRPVKKRGRRAARSACVGRADLRRPRRRAGAGAAEKEGALRQGPARRGGRARPRPVRRRRRPRGARPRPLKSARRWPPASSAAARSATAPSACCRRAARTGPTGTREDRRSRRSAPHAFHVPTIAPWCVRRGGRSPPTPRRSNFDAGRGGGATLGGDGTRDSLAQATARTPALESTRVRDAFDATNGDGERRRNFAASAMPCRRRSHKRTAPACEPSVTHVPSAEHRAATFADSRRLRPQKKLATVGCALRTSRTSTR